MIYQRPPKGHKVDIQAPEREARVEARRVPDANARQRMRVRFAPQSLTVCASLCTGWPR